MGWFTSIDLGLKDLDFSESDLEVGLMGKPLLEGVLGRLPPDRLLEDLEENGLLGPLRARGYRRFLAKLERSASSSERYRILGSHGSHHEELQLLDMKSRWASFESPIGKRYDVLSWEWLEFQDPAARPSSQRPLLPGQKHPGLGWYRTFLRLIRGYVRKLPVKAVVATPMFFHNAVLLSRDFRFLDPVRQGHFQAMCRDLLPQGIAPASWSVFAEEVTLVERSRRKTQAFCWEPGLCIRPLCPELERLVDNDAYRITCSQAMSQVAFKSIHVR